eukprot:TRINITY_DN11835_c0_g1_i1.p1 TRINITY_DN11835_c0_g1~~TRINITY_DN11835_c0_g1_i1.p1  ORF type:complete len:364 (+),score=63.07 TRINITY_DN11835_c0_g1_i1:243-1334(+)
MSEFASLPKSERKEQVSFSSSDSTLQLSSSSFQTSGIQSTRAFCPSNDVVSLTPNAFATNTNTFASFSDIDPKNIYTLSNKADSLYLESVSEVDPPATPSYLERTHFSSSASFASLWNAVIAFLTQMKIDFESQRQEFTLKCSIFRSVSFYIHFFSSSKNVRVVEFQRRSGCGLEFGSLFRQMQHEFAEKGLAQSSEAFGLHSKQQQQQSSQQQKSLDPMDLPDISTLQIDELKLSSSLETTTTDYSEILTMAKSLYFDVKCTAIQLISEMCDQSALQLAILNDKDVLPRLTEELRSMNEDVVRNVVHIVQSLMSSHATDVTSKMPTCVTSLQNARKCFKTPSFLSEIDVLLDTFSSKKQITA